MAPATIMTSLSLVPALLATSAADSLFTATPGCHTLLQDIAAQGHSDVELAAYCRANMPLQVCRDAVATLGSQPWSADRIASTCRRWEEQWNARVAAEAPGRAAMDFAEMQAKTDQCVKLKADAGLCKDTKTGAPLPLDKCAAWKLKVYPEQTKKWHDAMWSFYGTLAGQGQQGAPQRAQAQPTQAPSHGVGATILGAIGSAMSKGKQQKSEQVGPVANSGMARTGFLVGTAVVAAAFVAAAAAVTLGRFWRRAGVPEHAHALVRDSPESAAPGDA